MEKNRKDLQTDVEPPDVEREERDDALSRKGEGGEDYGEGGSIEVDAPPPKRDIERPLKEQIDRNRPTEGTKSRI